MVINILIPIGGKGQRFVDAGFKKPKPLIDLNGRPIIKWAVDTLKSSKYECRFIFIYNRRDQKNLEPALKCISPDHVFVDDNVENGMATACIEAKEYIKNENPVIVAACDQFVNWDFDSFIDFAINYDGVCPVFQSGKDAYSYVKVDKDFNVLRSAEKDAISNWANVGIYFFRHGKDFVEATQKMIDDEKLVKGEFYVAPVYNEYPQGKKIKAYPLKEEDVFILGTPEELTAAKGRLSNG